MTPDQKPIHVNIPVLNVGQFIRDNDSSISAQPIIQFKELAIDRVRYDQYKALCRQQPRKETKR